MMIMWPTILIYGMWVLFSLFSMSLNFYWLNVHNKICVAISNLWWSNNNIGIKDWTSHDFGMLIGSWCLLISWPNKRVLLDIHTIECEAVNKSWRCNLVSFEHVSLWCLFFRHWTTHQPNKGVWSKKNNQITYAYLKVWLQS